MPVIVDRKVNSACGCVGFLGIMSSVGGVQLHSWFEENMKVNMNIIVGGTDDILDNILSAARTVRKEMKNIFESVETETLQKADICVCLSGNISKYYPKSGIYQARYYSKAKKFMVYVHFSSNEWNSKKTESVSKFLKMYKDYLLELSDIIKKKTTKYKPDFDSRCYEDGIRRVFGNFWGENLWPQNHINFQGHKMRPWTKEQVEEIT